MLPFTLKNPTRSGYTFTGWTGSNGTTPQTTVTLSKGSKEDKTYTANWIANSQLTKPKCRIIVDRSPDYKGWYNKNVKINLVIEGIADEYGLSTTKNTINSIQKVTVNKDSKKQNGTIYYGYVKNSAGSSNCNITIKMDKTSPECTTKGTNNKWRYKEVTVKSTCKDNLSGCEKSTNYPLSNTKTYNTTKEIKTASVKYKDQAGNIGKCEYKVYLKACTAAPKVTGTTIKTRKCPCNSNESLSCIHRTEFSLGKCTRGIIGYMCYYNPNSVIATGWEDMNKKQNKILENSCNRIKFTYNKNNLHQKWKNNHTCFKENTWYYTRDTECVYIHVCNVSGECTNMACNKKEKCVTKATDMMKICK